MAEATSADFKSLVDAINKLNTSLSRNNRVDSGTTDTQLAAEIAASAEKLANFQKEISDNAEDFVDSEQKILDLQKQQINALEKLKILGVTLTGEQQKQFEQLVKTVNAEKESNEQKEKAVQLQSAANSLVDSYASRLLGIRNMSGEVDLFNEEGIKSIGTSIRNLIKPSNLLANLQRTISEETNRAIFSMMNAQASLAGVTTRSMDQIGSLQELANANVDLGLTYEEGGAALAAYQQNLVGFFGQSRETRAELVRFAARNERLGISFEESGQLIDQYTSVLGMSTEAAMESIDAVIELGRANGRSAAQTVQAFQAAQQALIGYGASSTELSEDFVDLSQDSGVAVTSLISATDAFRDYSTAVGFARTITGLGLRGPDFDQGTLSSLRTADDLSRLVGGLSNQLSSFGEGSQAYRQGLQILSGGLGLTSEEFMRLANEANGVTRELSDTEREQRTLNEIAAAAVGPQQKLAAVFQQFAIAVEPIADFLLGVLTGVADLTKAFPLFGEVMAGFFVASKIGLLGKAFTALKVGLFGVSTTAPAAGLGLAGFLASVATAAPVAVPAILILGALSLALAGITTSVGYLVSSTADLISSIGQLSPQNLRGLSTGLSAIGRHGATAATGLDAFTEAVERLSAAGTGLGADTFAALSSSMYNLHQAVETVDAKPAAVTRVVEVMNKAEELASAQEQVRQSVLAEISTATNAVANSATTSANGEGSTIIINVDGRELARTVTRSLSGNVRGRLINS
jgi:hypothetical protein